MQTQLETTLEALIAIPSESSSPEACHDIIEYTRRKLDALDLHVTTRTETDHPWLMATTQATSAPKVLLVAHLDVVPAANPEQYQLKKTGDRLYGRGVWDMKYAAACYLEFLKVHADELSHMDIGILFTTDEEIGGYDGVAKVLEDGWRTDIAIIPDYGDDWRIEEKAKGMHVTKLIANGTSAHGSRPWEGDNSLSKFISLLHELQTAYPSSDPMKPTVSVNALSAGQAPNQIPDTGFAWVDFRAFEKQEIETYKTFLGKLCQRYDITIENAISGHPLTLDKENVLVKAFIESLRAAGIALSYRQAYGGTDGRWFAEHNIPCIVTGPHGENAHGANEWIRRSDLLMFYTILEDFVTKNARQKLDESR